MSQLRSTSHNCSIRILESDLPSPLTYVFSATSRAIQDLILNLRLARWRLISTAPSNQELELRIVEGGKFSVLEFPCMRTNAGAWLNVDLGAEMSLEAAEWRTLAA
jgi:hypothetical protein